MFDDIHGRYDLLNTVLSFGQDRRWRKLTVLELPSSGIVIDLCSGGGELAMELFSRRDFQGEIVLADISTRMISLYRRVLGPKYEGRYFPVVCDVENLPFKDDIFNGAMSAFSLRNLTDLRRFTEEVRRVLRMSGVAHYLEIAHPRNKAWGALFKFYFYRLSPLLARLFTRKTYAYRYLPGSLRAFPMQDDIKQILGDGWQRCEYRNIMGGIAAVYILEKGQDTDA
jgi:demethylmenaquinone methyltransferase/2-methoxy-6-polyprenyl-1,4-benzoquinol methylase